MISDSQRKLNAQLRDAAVQMNMRIAMKEPSKEELRQQLKEAFENTARLGWGLPPITRLPAKEPRA